MAKQSNNHFVSRFYLKYWANSDNKVWVLHKTDETEKRQTKNSEQVHIKFICSEEKLYWIGEDTIIEKWSDKNIETICGSVFKKVIENEEITDKDIDYIKAFLALNISRHPSLKQVSKQLMDVFDTHKKQTNPLAQTLHKRVEIHLNVFAPLYTQIFRVPDTCSQSFITSDVPFVIIVTNPKNLIDDTYYWFPISPKRAISLSSKKTTSLYRDLDCNQVQKANMELALIMQPNIMIANDPKSFTEDVIKIFNHVSEGDKK